MASVVFVSDLPPARALEFTSREVSVEKMARAIERIATSSEINSLDHSPMSRARIRVAKQAQAHIDTHYMDAVHLQDLCRVTGVGARTLQRCFRDYFRVTVSNYLKTARLEAARRELESSSQEKTSVTKIAMQNGCTHLGRFSVEFRERYGVSPRELLSRSAG